MKRKLLAMFVMSIMAPVFVGCGPRRTTTVDPPLDPIFRDTGPALGRRKSPPARSRSSSRSARSSRAARSSRGIWTVSNLSNRWKYIIVHHSATEDGGARRFDRAHRSNGMDELGYHFVIGNGTDTPDGKIEVGSRWRRQKHGAHCRVSQTDSNEYNKHGIGICLVGNFEKSRPTDAQMKSLAYLTNGLLAQTRLRPSAVSYHRDFKSTKCPGRYFPNSTYRRALHN